MNTPNFEFRPSLSGGRLLFGRLALDSHTETIRVFTQASGKTRVLDTIHSDATHSVAPGQISGKFAVWHRCAPTCNVLEWNRQTDTVTKLVNGGGKAQWWAAVAPDGTAYYVREGVQCDSVAKIVADPLNGPPEVIFTLPDGTTASHLSVDDEGAMGRRPLLLEGHVRDAAHLRRAPAGDLPLAAEHVRGELVPRCGATASRGDAADHLRR